MKSSKKQTKDITQQKIPKNPRYENVEPTIDTGASISKHLRKIEEIKQNFKIRKDELFKRMKVTTFAQLVLQVAEINNHLYFGDDMNASINSAGTKDDASDTGTIESQRSTFQSVISGVGELDVNEQQTPRNQDVTKDEVVVNGRGDCAQIKDEDMPYLLLDVRDRDEYDVCHIIKSYSYPSAMLCRSVNFETKQMLQCRNQPGKIIIIYDEDERIAPRVAETLVQRGYDNLFMLSGGLRVAYKTFPAGMVTGRIPKSIKEFIKQSSSSTNRRNTTGGSVVSGRSTVASNNTTTTNNDMEPPIMQSEFTMQDLAQISLTLDAIVESEGKSTTSSIYSRQSSRANSVIGSTSSSRMGSQSVSSIYSGQVDHKKPFKI